MTGVAELGAALAAGRISSVEATTDSLAAIAAGAELGAFLAVDADAALAAARAAPPAGRTG